MNRVYVYSSSRALRRHLDGMEEGEEIASETAREISKAKQSERRECQRTFG